MILIESSWKGWGLAGLFCLAAYWKAWGNRRFAGDSCWAGAETKDMHLPNTAQESVEFSRPQCKTTKQSQQEGWPLRRGSIPSHIEAQTNFHPPSPCWPSRRVFWNSRPQAVRPHVVSRGRLTVRLEQRLESWAKICLRNTHVCSLFFSYSAFVICSKHATNQGWRVW